jgi:hypothetical protein
MVRQPTPAPRQLADFAQSAQKRFQALAMVSVQLGYDGYSFGEVLRITRRAKQGSV